MRFCSHLADRLHHSSIKVYLSGICSLHLDMGFSDPLSNCLQLQWVLCSINSHQGSHESPCQSVTGEFKKIQSSLLPQNDLHTMFWAACCLGFFWLFKGLRIYCQLLFRCLHSPLLSGPICNWIPHPTPPIYMCTSKRTPFFKDALFISVVAIHISDPLLLWWHTFIYTVQHQVLSLFSKMVKPCLGCSCFISFIQLYLQLGNQDPSLATASELGQQPRQLSRVF